LAKDTVPVKRPGKKAGHAMDVAYRATLKELEALRHDLLELEKKSAELLQRVNVRHRDSAINLVHYLGLRRKDIRPLQQRLSELGLSSLGRTESHVLASLKETLIKSENCVCYSPCG
jgi:pyruvate kinase